MKLLFVCHGNICRSVGAEYICNHLIKKYNYFNISCDSAAISYEEIGNPIYPPMEEVLIEHGVEIGSHRARIVTKQDYLDFDYIFIMNDENKRGINRIIPHDINNKIYKILEFIDKSGDIEDPWHTGRYSKVYNQLYEAIEIILSKINLQKLNKKI